MKIVHFTIFLAFITLQLNCKNQKINHVSLVFLQDEIKSQEVLHKIKEELFYNSLTDSVSLTGQPYPVVIIELSREHLLRYGLTYKKVKEAIKNEITSSTIESGGNSNIIINSKDLENHNKYSNLDALSNLAIEIVQSGMVIRLKDIAKITLELHSPQKIYQGEKVEILSFKFLGKTKKELEETLQFIASYGLRYKTLINKPNLKLDIQP